MFYGMASAGVDLSVDLQVLVTQLDSSDSSMCAMDNTSVTGCDTLVRSFFSVQTSGVHLTAHRPREPLLFAHASQLDSHAH